MTLSTLIDNLVILVLEKFTYIILVPHDGEEREERKVVVGAAEAAQAAKDGTDYKQCRGALDHSLHVLVALQFKLLPVTTHVYLNI